jgi:hypothetical protein
MTNAERILRTLATRLSAPVELTLYGRAALTLGFDCPPREYALSLDVDAVLWTGQAEELNDKTDFWPAVEAVNATLAPEGLYVSHFFTEDQVILLPTWRANRRRIPGDWGHLALFRLGDLDLLLSKLMRDDPVDQSDAAFIALQSGLTQPAIEAAIRAARVPAAEEIQEQFALASARLLKRLGRATASSCSPRGGGECH